MKQLYILHLLVEKPWTTLKINPAFIFSQTGIQTFMSFEEFPEFIVYGEIESYILNKIHSPDADTAPISSK